MKKIVLTGPESTGKSTLAEDLATYYDTFYIPEYAREFINDLDRPYTEADILEIAIEQVDRDNKGTSQYPDILIADTDLLTLIVWSNFKYGKCDPWIVKSLSLLLPDLYLLCAPDLPWESDSQRENPKDREALFEIYKTEIEKLGVPYKIVTGTDKSRLQNAINHIESI